MSKDIDFSKLDVSAAGKKAGAVFKRYAAFSFLVIVLCVYAFLIFRINMFTNTEPTDDQVLEKTKTTKRLRIDQSSIDKIQQLKDQNVGVQSLFEEARENPFQD